MIHDSVGGGLVGAILIFGGCWVTIVAAASIALNLVAKNIDKLQPRPDADAEEAAA